METLAQVAFLVFLCGSMVLWIHGVVCLFIIFYLAKKREQDFFKKYIVNNPESKSEFRQFWVLVKQGKSSEFKNGWLRKKAGRLGLWKKIFLMVFIITCLLLFYLWAQR